MGWLFKAMRKGFKAGVKASGKTAKTGSYMGSLKQQDRDALKAVDVLFKLGKRKRR